MAQEVSSLEVTKQGTEFWTRSVSMGWILRALAQSGVLAGAGEGGSQLALVLGARFSLFSTIQS